MKPFHEPDSDLHSMASTRREFLAACVALTLSSSRLLADVSAPEIPDSVLHALIQTLLPIEDPEFPIRRPEELVIRIRGLLSSLTGDEQHATSTALLLFDDLQASSTIQNEGPPSASKLSTEERAKVEALRESPNPRVNSFRELTLDRKREYLSLWSHSQLPQRRQFYRSVKSLVMAATYSMDSVWLAIGYEGPLKRRRS